MQTTAKLRYLRQSPRKVRLVVDMIRGLEVSHALEQLKFSDKRAAQAVTKLLNSAIANAEHNHKLKKDNLFIKEIKVDEGPALKRWRARAFGRAAGIKKRTSHISLVLAEIKPTLKKEDKKKDKQPQVETKVVKSLDEVKEVASTDDEVKDKKVKEEDKGLKTKEEYKPEPVDTARLGKDRSKQHLDKIRKKGKGGGLKRFFRRKSV